jgi:hypothetical protein
MTFQSFCKTCPFYALRAERELGQSERYWHSGECRKNAPYGQGNLFPAVNERDWCGDHPDNSIPEGLLVMEPEDKENNTLIRYGDKRRASYARF